MTTHENEPRDPVITEAFDAVERVMQAPPFFFQGVMARVEQPQPRQSIFAAASSQLSGAWGLALAACLLLSLTFNALWGAGVLGPPVAVQPRVYTVQAGPWQDRIHNGKELAGYIIAHSVSSAESDGLGLVALPAPALFFRAGTGYAETLALLRGDQTTQARQRVNQLIEALDAAGTPDVLIAYLREMQALIEAQRLSGATLTRFLALFETLYESAYQEQSEGAALTLFRTGAWLENMYLATQAGDRAALQQGPESAYFKHALQPLGVRPELLNALEQIGHHVSQPTISGQDIAAVRTLVQRLQHQLSN